MKYINFRTSAPRSRDGNLEVKDVASNKRYHVDAIQLAKAVAVSENLPAKLEEAATEVDDRFSSWLEKGWEAALPYFLSTLDEKYDDAHENFAQSHKTVLAKYAEQDPMPVPHAYARSLESRVSLPRPQGIRSQLANTLTARRSTLVPNGEPLRLDHLSTILWYGTDRIRSFREPKIMSDPQMAMTNFGSALELYLFVYEVDGLTPGTYAYEFQSHSLVRLADGPSRQEARNFLVGQPAPETAAVSIVYVAEVARHQWRYRHARALRGMWIDQAKAVNELLWQLAKFRIRPHMTPATADSAILNALALPVDLSWHPAYVVTFSGPEKVDRK